MFSATAVRPHTHIIGGSRSESAQCIRIVRYSGLTQLPVRECRIGVDLVVPRGGGAVLRPAHDGVRLDRTGNSQVRGERTGKRRALAHKEACNLSTLAATNCADEHSSRSGRAD